MSESSESLLPKWEALKNCGSREEAGEWVPLQWAWFFDVFCEVNFFIHKHRGGVAPYVFERVLHGFANFWRSLTIFALFQASYYGCFKVSKSRQMGGFAKMFLLEEVAIYWPYIVNGCFVFVGVAIRYVHGGMGCGRLACQTIFPSSVFLWDVS